MKPRPVGALMLPVVSSLTIRRESSIVVVTKPFELILDAPKAVIVDIGDCPSCAMLVAVPGLAHQIHSRQRKCAESSHQAHPYDGDGLPVQPAHERPRKDAKPRKGDDVSGQCPQGLGPREGTDRIEEAPHPGILQPALACVNWIITH